MRDGAFRILLKAFPTPGVYILQNFHHAAKKFHQPNIADSTTWLSRILALVRVLDVRDLLRLVWLNSKIECTSLVQVTIF